MILFVSENLEKQWEKKKVLEILLFPSSLNDFKSLGLSKPEDKLDPLSVYVGAFDALLETECQRYCCGD